MFTEHDCFFHMSYGLSEWLINLSTTYYIRIRSSNKPEVKTKLWKKILCDMPQKILETKCDAE